MNGNLTLIDRLQEMDFGEQVLDLVDVLLAMVDEAQEAKAFLTQQELAAAVLKSAFEYLIQVPSLAGVALSPHEISQRMVARGYKPHGELPELYAAHLLRSYPSCLCAQGIVVSRWPR
jgi:hypothetical protein